MKECYFCLSERMTETSAQRKIQFDNQIFSFYRCGNCFGYSLYPKLSTEQIQNLYSLDYVKNLSSDEPTRSTDDTRRFVELQLFLNSLPENQKDSFLDYGCGADPSTFKISQQCGLAPVGMEFSQDVRDAVMIKTGKKIYSRDDLMGSNELFDIIFLGDVIEHLVNPEIELESLRRKLKVGGVLIAQGPLEGSWTLTHFVVILFALLTRGKLSEFPPYHVSLATRRSMLKIMKSSGFKNVNIKCTEVTWPAPSLKLVISNPNPRNLIMLICKGIDKTISKFIKGYGSRFFLTCEGES